MSPVELTLATIGVPFGLAGIWAWGRAETKEQKFRFAAWIHFSGGVLGAIGSGAIGLSFTDGTMRNVVLFVVFGILGVATVHLIGDVKREEKREPSQSMVIDHREQKTYSPLATPKALPVGIHAIGVPSPEHHPADQDSEVLKGAPKLPHSTEKASGKSQKERTSPRPSPEAEKLMELNRARLSTIRGYIPGWQTNGSSGIAPSSAHFLITNKGQSPAKNIVVMTALVSVGPGDELRSAPAYSAPFTTPEIPRDESSDICFTPSPDGLNRLLEAQAKNPGKWRFLFFLHLSYDDLIFGKHIVSQTTGELESEGDATQGTLRIGTVPQLNFEHVTNLTQK